MKRTILALGAVLLAAGTLSSCAIADDAQQKGELGQQLIENAGKADQAEQDRLDQAESILPQQ